MYKAFKILRAAFVLASASGMAHAESQQFECGFPTDLGYGAGNNAVCYQDPAKEERFLRRGDHCRVEPPEDVDQVSSFRLYLDTETQTGVAEVVVMESRSLIDVARKKSDEENTEKSREVLADILKGRTQVHKVECHFRSSYTNFVDPITGKLRENEADRRQAGHVFLLSGEHGPSALFIDDETASAMWTRFVGLGQAFFSKTMFGHCKQVQ
jgi:hypothetical protein